MERTDREPIERADRESMDAAPANSGGAEPVSASNGNTAEPVGTSNSGAANGGAANGNTADGETSEAALPEDRGMTNAQANAAALLLAMAADTEGRTATEDREPPPAVLTDDEVKDLSARLGGLVIFRDILRDPAVQKLDAALSLCARGKTDKFLRHLAAFEMNLFGKTDNWTEYLSHLLMESENVCIRDCGRATLSTTLLEALHRELDFLQRLSCLRMEELPGVPDFMTGWRTSEADIPSSYRERMERVGSLGYGMFAHYHVFTLKEGALLPVRHPDPQTLEELPGYERERSSILANTEALLAERPANNVLLYGDAGTGKSSTVKAIANAYADQGLRLVEVKKNQLYELPELMDDLASNPLKFILFIDDLSFMVNDDNFAALKAILEGSVGGRAGNVAVYATSNRRHLIKETLTDRTGDDIHASDTRQELMSLSARFGLTVTFSSPDRERYLYIVRKLAEHYGVHIGEPQISVRAEAFAIRAGGRSARVARQFVELCKAGVLAN